MEKETGKLIHLITRGKRWAVVISGRRASKINLSKKQALYFAKKLAKKKSITAIVIHNKTGMVEKFINLLTNLK